MRIILAKCLGLSLTLGVASLGGATAALAAPGATLPAQAASYNTAESGLLQPVQYRLNPRERARIRERERMRERMAQRRRYYSRH